jgi:hypothetical protein
MIVGAQIQKVLKDPKSVGTYPRVPRSSRFKKQILSWAPEHTFYSSLFSMNLPIDAEWAHFYTPAQTCFTA